MDATYASGQPGIALQTATVDDFDAGPFASGTAWQASAGFTGAGALTARLNAIQALTGAMHGAGALTANMVALEALDSIMHGTGALTAQMAQILRGQAVLSGAGALTANLDKLLPPPTVLVDSGQVFGGRSVSPTPRALPANWCAHPYPAADRHQRPSHPQEIGRRDARISPRGS